MAIPDFTVRKPQIYTNSLTPLIAIPLSSTQFSNAFYLWDFGDGTTSIAPTANHIYDNPGIYDITLTQYLSTGERAVSDSQTITAYNVIPNTIFWEESSLTDFLDVSQKKQNGLFYFNIMNSYQFGEVDEVSFDLYCQNSKSQPFTFDKDAHLKPTWRFLNSSDEVVERITAPVIKLYGYLGGSDTIVITTDPNQSPDSIYLGLSARAGFNFIDDIATSAVTNLSAISPLYLTVTQNLSVAFSDTGNDNIPYIKYPTLIHPIYINDRVPTQLKITSNGFFDIDYLKFQNTKIPYNIFVSDDNGNLLKTNPNADVDGITIYPLTVGFTNNIPLSVPFSPNYKLSAYSSDPLMYGGYFENYFIPISAFFTQSVKLTATTLLDYISHANGVFYGFASLFDQAKIYRIRNIPDQVLDVSNSLLTDVQNQFVSEPAREIEVDQDFSGVFGITVDSNYNAWLADANNSLIYKYDKDFNLTNTYVLSTFSNIISGHSTPAQISLDENEDAWITLYDSGSAVKIDTGDNITFYEPLGIQNMYNSTFGVGTIQPTAIEATNSTVIITYTSELSANRLTINSKDFLTTSDINFDQIQILDLVSDSSMSNFYALGKHYINNQSYIYKFTNSTATSTYSNVISAPWFKNAEFLTIDTNQTVWASFSANNLAAWDETNTILSSYTVGSGTGAKNINYIGGLSCDHLGNLWVMHVLDKSLYFIPVDDISNKTSITLNIDEFNGAFNIVAYGDWNGWESFNKFGLSSTISTISLYGESEPFIINPEASRYVLPKINENFDMTETIKSYRTIEPLFSDVNFFDNFWGTIVGNQYSPLDSFGKTIFEKIANFVINHSDPDTCNVESIKSLSNEVNIDFENDIIFPNQVKRLVNLFSISFKRLWGDEFTTGFLETATGNQLDFLTYAVSANPQVKIIAIEKYNYNHVLIEPIFIDDVKSPTYPLSSFDESWGWGLSVPDGALANAYYDFYEYVALNKQKIFSLIDWDNVLATTSLSSLSSYDAYISQRGIISESMGKELRDGLNLFL